MSKLRRVIADTLRKAAEMVAESAPITCGAACEGVTPILTCTERRGHENWHYDNGACLSWGVLDGNSMTASGRYPR